MKTYQEKNNKQTESESNKTNKLVCYVNKIEAKKYLFGLFLSMSLRDF
jgi:hypothetical protein